MRSRIVATAAVLIAAGVVVVVAFGTSVAVDWLWFSSLGYAGVFRTLYVTEIAVFLAVFVASALCLWVSGALALRHSRPLGPWLAEIPGLGTMPVRSLSDLIARVVPPWAWRLAVLAAALFLAVLIATSESGNAMVVLRFIDRVPYGMADPIFGKDIGFYLFSLPALTALLHWAMTTLLLTAIVAFVVYWGRGGIAVDQKPWHVSTAAMVHGSVLLGLFFALKAAGYLLDRYDLLYDDNGVVIGAGYADIHAALPILWIFIGFVASAAVVSWLNVFWRTRWLPTVAVVGFCGLVALTLFIPPLVERIYVKPSELQLETPYLKDNITLTQDAYDLGHVTVEPFPVEQGLTLASLEADRGTTDNIRLWDTQPLMDTYSQLQEIRTYYKFYDVDVDRYDLGQSYQQVMLSAREINPTLLPDNARTWVNLHLLFTHGNGIVMSPVTHKTEEGLPDFYEKDIPPVATDNGPAVAQPRIYFGEGPQTYAIVKTSTQEFDYPKGSENVYTTYDGTAGLALGGVLRRTLFAWYFGDPNILISRYVTDGSRILIRRNIADRVAALAPFLRLDRDPYIVASGGRLFWIQDAYTTSSWFPYSQPAADGDINYIRNSVKVVIDAYNGSVDFYDVDPKDPVLATYRRIFPGMFKPLAAMPEDLQRHIRYPEDIFLLQAEIYKAYHMSAPEVFYNREDLWQFPRRTSDVGAVEGDAGARMAPYYTIMRLPEETRAAFFLMLPMVPNRRENMIALLAGGCDPPDYGKLIIYEFPKDKLVYGPFQIEARINQNTAISQQISLWNQMGSRVIRGNVLVIPIGKSILYVTPLYLRAAMGQLPELKRVIAAYGDRVVMTQTLPEALAALFSGAPAPGSAPAAPVIAAGSAAPQGAAATAAREALGDYNEALDRLKSGDWAGFGKSFDSLQPLLQGLSGGGSGH